MAKITRKQVDDINARLLNGWKFDTRHFMLNGEKSVTMEIPLDEKYELSASISFYDSYECFEKIGAVVKIRVSKWENIGNGMIRSCDCGKSRAIAYTKPRKMFKDIEILTAFITKEDIMEIYNGTEETAEITNIRMNSKGLWERVRENSEPMPEAVAETTPETGNLKPTKKRINALQQIVKANKEENRIAIQTEKAQFFGNGFMFVMLVASCFIAPLSQFFSNIADGMHHMAGTFKRVAEMAESTLKEKLDLPTIAELKEIKKICKADGKSIVDFGEKLPRVNADYLQQILEALSGKVDAWQANKNNVYLKDEHGNVAYLMGIQTNAARVNWKITLERNRELEKELHKQESENFVKQVIADVERIAEAEEAAEKQENSVEESTPTTEKPTSTEEQPESPKGESIMNNTEIPTIKNLSQLKKALKANSGMMFEILDHNKPERIGEIRKVTSVNSVSFTSRVIDESGEMTGKDIYVEFEKACYWKFESEKISYLFTTGDVIMSFRFITENSIMNDNSIMSKYNTEEQSTTENLTAETPVTEQSTTENPIEEPKTAWTGKADYAERRAEKAERYAERAEKARATADRLQKPINDMHGDIAFFTQPNINTSAGRAFTNQRNRMFASYEKGFEERSKAAYYDEKSENLSKEPTAISSDDPEALRKLKEKLEKLTAEHKEHLAHNKALTKAIKNGTATRNSMGYYELNGKMTYFTTNESAEIRRLKDRIEELENLKVPEDYSFDGGEIVFNVSENRVQILFDSIPDPETRTNLKRNGFKWSPRQKAWQRMLNQTGIRTVERLYPRPIEEPAPTEENSVEEVVTTTEETNNETTENIVYPFILVDTPTVQPETTAEETIIEAEEKPTAQPVEEQTEEKATFFNADLARLIAKRPVAYDEIEDIAYILFEKGYTEKHKPSEKALFGYHLPETELYALAEKYHNGEDITIELAKKLLNHGEEKIEIVFDNGKITDKTYHFKKEMCRKLHTEYVENGVDCRFGESDRLITFEEIGKAFIEICRDEYNDILSWREQEDTTENQTAEPPIETITVEDTEIAVEKIPEVILEYKGDSEKLAMLKDKALSLGATVSSTENHLTIDTYENHRPEIESVATELGLKTDEEMCKTFNAVQGKINEVGTIEQKNIIYKIPWGIYRRYSAEDIINVVLTRTNDILSIKTENRLKAVSALIDSRLATLMTTDKAMKLIADNMEKSGATAEQITQAEIAIQYIGNPNFRQKLNDYVFAKTYKTEENTSTDSIASDSETSAQWKIRPPPMATGY